MNSKVELLAPAGNIESFYGVINAGADAIYMGLGKYNARAMAKNFTMDEYLYCLDYAHLRGVKIYLTLNTLVTDDEIPSIMNMLLKLYERGLDGVLVQDIGLANVIHNTLPSLALHASTQMSVYSLEQVKFLEKLGFKRVVLARELTIDEIRNIIENTNIEIEIFVHGALCVSVSGQCLMSYAIGNRSANKGECAQPCRMKYSLYNGKNEEIIKDKYLLSKKDIFGLDIIKELIELNVSSLKIEGRNKIPEYGAYIVSMYRKYIDKYYDRQNVELSKNDEKNVLQMFNRNGKSNGYLKGVRYRDSISDISPKNTGIYLGDVIAQNGKIIKVKLADDVSLHDGIEIYSNGKVISTIVTYIKDEKNNKTNIDVEKGNIVCIGDIKEKVKNGSKVFKTTSSRLLESIKNNYLKNDIRKRKIDIIVKIHKNENVEITTNIKDKEYRYVSEYIPENAINKELSFGDIKDVFSKTKENSIEIDKLTLDLDNGLFLKRSTLNEIRRTFISKVEEQLYIRNDITGIDKEIEEFLKNYNINKIKKEHSKKALSVCSYNKNIDYSIKYNNFDRIDFTVKDYVKNEDEIFRKYGKYTLGITISNFDLKNESKYIEDNLERLVKKGVKVIVFGSFKHINLVLDLKKKYNITLVADYTFNISNSYSASFFENFLGIDFIVLSIDLEDKKQIEKLNKNFNIENINGQICTMTSRYCIIGSFVANRKYGKACSIPCIKDRYYIKDFKGEKYDIICNNLDCTMKIMKNINKNNIYMENIRINVI